VKQCNSITSFGCNVGTQVDQRNVVYQYRLAQGCGKSSVINVTFRRHACAGGVGLIIAHRKQRDDYNDATKYLSHRCQSQAVT
jgi:hypothetical protein